jgi:hypothetical protein
VEARTLDLELERSQIELRLADLPHAPPKYTRGYGRLYLDHVLQADTGCDFDFLRARPGEPAASDPLGLVGGPIGGW